MIPAPRWTSPLRTAEGVLLPSDGPKVCKWIERHCVYGEGDWYGKPVRLRPWQKRFIYRLYEHREGVRRYKRAILGIAKGNGKSPIASWIGAYELLSQTRRAPRVAIGAASLKQANLVFGDLTATVTLSPTLRDHVDAYKLEIQLKNGAGVAERIAAEAGTNDGARATAFIADELHEWTGERERVFMVMDGAVAKRESAFSLAISTAGVLGDGVLNRLYEYGGKVASGEIVDDSFLFEWYEADPALELENPEEWMRAVFQANPAAGDFCSVENLKHRYRTMPIHEFRRYHLNQFVEPVQEQAIPMDKWDLCAGRPGVPGEGVEVWLGVDAALSRDTAAVAAVWLDRENERFATSIDIFEADPESGIEFSAIENRIREYATHFRVVECAYDPFAFTRSAQDLLEEGIPMTEVRQDASNMTPASQALFDFVNEGRLVHEGDPKVRAQIAAAVAKQTERGWRLSKQKSRAPIDAAVALAMACWRARLDERAPTPNVSVMDEEQVDFAV